MNRKSVLGNLDYIIAAVALFGIVFFVTDYGEKALVQRFVALSEKSRRAGLLALEEEIEDFEDPFMRSGLKNVSLPPIHQIPSVTL